MYITTKQRRHRRHRRDSSDTGEKFCKWIFNMQKDLASNGTVATLS